MRAGADEVGTVARAASGTFACVERLLLPQLTAVVNDLPAHDRAQHMGLGNLIG